MNDIISIGHVVTLLPVFVEGVDSPQQRLADDIVIDALLASSRYLKSIKCCVHHRTVMTGCSLEVLED